MILSGNKFLVCVALIFTLAGCDHADITEVYYSEEATHHTLLGPYMIRMQKEWYKVAIQNQKEKCQAIFLNTEKDVPCLTVRLWEGKARSTSSLVDPSRKTTSVPRSLYAFAPESAAHDENIIIDVEAENALASQRIKNLPISDVKVIIVPGFTPQGRKKPKRLHPIALERLKKAVALYQTDPHYIFIVTGGNVYPKHTIYNEGYEMKKALMQEFDIPEDRILLEPYARNSVTNLRNAGRLMLAHGLESAIIVTSKNQTFYFSYPAISTFSVRSQFLLGHSVGGLTPINANQTLFKPSERVFLKNKHKSDP